MSSASSISLDNFSLREYAPGDADAMYALDLECFQPPFRFTQLAMQRFAQQKDAIVLLAEADNQLAGFVIAHMEGRTAYVVTLDVAPTLRHRGLARRLMAETELRALVAGAQEVALHVFTGNTGAMTFYESLGYNRVSRAENFYAIGTHALVYRKKLSTENA